MDCSRWCLWMDFIVPLKIARTVTTRLFPFKSEVLKEGKDYRFQQEIALYRISNSTMQWPSGHFIDTLGWLSKSDDLNIIEKSWVILSSVVQWCAATSWLIERKEDGVVAVVLGERGVCKHVPSCRRPSSDNQPARRSLNLRMWAELLLPISP